MTKSERLSPERMAERREQWQKVAIAAQELMPGDVAREIVGYLDALESAYAALAQAERERDEAIDKALRFDLDQAGIERREAESVELVDLRAEVERLREELDHKNRELWSYLPYD